MEQVAKAVTDALTKRLTIEEGLRLKPYRCTAGKLSIGIGRNLDDRGITKEEAEYLLANDLQGVYADLDRNLPWWREMNEARQVVIADMCFNLGISRLLGFKNTLSAMRAGNYFLAADGMLNSAWAKQVGNRAVNLAHIMLKGI